MASGRIDTVLGPMFGYIRSKQIKGFRKQPQTYTIAIKPVREIDPLNRVF